MPIAQNFEKFRTKLSATTTPLFYFGLTAFFFAISNGISSYYFPLLALQSGMSNSTMGLLYASSSVFGAVFDLLLSKYLKNTQYQRLYVYAIFLMILFPLLLVSSSLMLIYVIASAVWALYSNLSSFADYDFVAVEEEKESHAKSFASLSIMNDLGYVVAPLIAGATVMTIGKPTTAIYPMLAGFLALLFISLTINSSKRIKHLSKKQNEHPSRDFKQEMKTLIIVGRRLWPFMLLTINLALMESAFWTIAPLLENVSSSFAGLGGIFLAVSMVPSLVISWSVEPLTRSFGKKKTAFYTFLFANLLLLTVGYLTNAYMILLIIFLVNLLEAITFPAASAAFADYLKESNSYDNEIIAAKDFAGNIGYIIGPLVAGISLDLIGDLKIFTVFATVGVITSLILILFTPKKIPFYDKNVKNDS